MQSRLSMHTHYVKFPGLECGRNSDTFAYPSWLPLVFYLFRLFLLPVQPLHLSSSRSKTVPRCERAIHMFRGRNRSSDPLSKDYKASGVASRPEYEVCYGETNPSYFANNSADVARQNVSNNSTFANRNIKTCAKDWIV